MGGIAGRGAALALGLAQGLMLGLTSTACLADDAAWQHLPMAITLGAESVRLPAGERMGLVGSSVLFELADGWWAGPAVYGAASGQRGGLFVGGLALQRQWALAPRWQAAAGLALGGGGGAAAPVGDGLMARPAASLLYDLGPLQAGLSWSALRFSGGRIDSRQLGLLLAWDGRYRHTRAAAIGQALDDGGRTGFGFDTWRGTVSRYRLHDGSSRALGLLGAQLLRHEPLGEGLALAWGLEAAAAGRGGAAGYMELLGSAALQQRLAPGWEASLRLAAGLGGGGGVVGGGLLTKAQLGLAWSPRPGWQVGLEAGPVRAAHGQPRAGAWQLFVRGDFGAPAGDGAATAAATVSDWAWSAGLQAWTSVARSDGRREAVGLISGQFNRRVGERAYLTAQAHSALAGGAGAFSVGLAGAGLAWPLGDRATLGLELTAGAAGGGGVAAGSGAVLLGQVWAGWGLGDGQWRLSAGRVRGLRGGATLDSPVLGLAWHQRFGLGAR